LINGLIVPVVIHWINTTIKSKVLCSSLVIFYSD
jgi:hypothetical protein